jgi:predicted O-linked N-acetylglucosamine transferase (SPINDLY family)
MSDHPAQARFVAALDEERAGRPAAAEAAYRTVLADHPDHVGCLRRLGALAAQARRYGEASAFLRRALRVQPRHAAIHVQLGHVWQRSRKLDEAAAAFALAVQLDPQQPEAHLHLALAQHELGLHDAALASLRRALALDPDRRVAHDNLLFQLQHHPATDTPLLRAEQARWRARFVSPLAATHLPHANPRDPARRLRVAYVAVNPREHPESCWLLPLLIAHDRTRFEVHVYANVDKADATTALLQAHTDHWHDIHGWSDEALARDIRAAGIDLLVDLALHTAGSRLIAFARRPAPVQVAYLMLQESAALGVFDYRLTFPELETPATQHPDDTEHPAVLPRSWGCWEPLGPWPEIVPPPATRTGRVTFGSLNRFNKINDPLLARWARVLLAVPASRLLLRAPDGAARVRVRERFSALGIAPDRVAFVGSQTQADYRATYGQIDLALDPSPYNGYTTTCDALWLGVPVLTLPHPRPAGRSSVGLLHAVSLPELVATDEDDYIRRAAALAADLPRLTELRTTLRARVAASPVRDGPGFTRDVETAYRAMWRRWCENE